MTHSTGATKRLDRDGIANIGPFGCESYSNEELIAEMGAAMLTAIAGLEQPATLTNSAAYLAHWIGELKGDKRLIVKTAGAAHRAVDHILGTFDGAE